MELAPYVDLLIVILEVAFGLGFVIFVHELGHFAVAKWCGVKCEKFYLGFDIGGLKLAKFQYGETEYGIGVLPLGGYVKMLGQDDNPSRAAEERERSIVKSAAADGGSSATAVAAPPAGDEKLDPRSYMAQSVPKRMAIISAGVIMNVIFAFIMAVIAFRLGVPDTPCAIGGVLPGDPAWQAGMRSGDKIIEINGVESKLPLRFRDLQTSVVLGNSDEGVRFKIERKTIADPQKTEEVELNITPTPATSKNDRLAPMIGVFPLPSTTLSKKLPVLEDSPAAAAGKFKDGGTIVSVGGTPVESYPELHGQFVQHGDEQLKIGISREADHKAKAAEGQAAEQLTVPLDPNPLRTLGLAMKIGAITAVQDKSPAAEAGLKPGDTITSVDGQSPGDPLTLPQRLRRNAGKTITVGWSHPTGKGEPESQEKQISLRPAGWPDPSVLGVAYDISNVIESVEANGPAAAAKVLAGKSDGEPAPLQTGDVVVKAEFLPKKPEAATPFEKRLVQHPVEFGEDVNWPYFMDIVDNLPAEDKVRLTLADGRTVEILPAASKEWFTTDHDRGLNFEQLQEKIRADSWAQAIGMGARETKESLLQVYRFLRKVFAGQVSPLGLGGPITIAQAAGGAATKGVSTLLLFLTMLSANLAVINFLPIPLLDGGHMAFLAMEGIRGKPVSERIVVGFHYMGFAFIIGLMLFVLSLDFGIIPRFSQSHQRAVRVAMSAPVEPAIAALRHPGSANWG